MKRTVVFVLLAAMLFLCGCQPTPEVEYVPNKGDNVAEDKINATALPTASPNVNESDETSDPAVIDTSSPWDEATGQAVFPERWEDDIKTDYKEMIISADVVTSGTNSYPVHLVRKTDYTSEDILKVAEYLFRDKDVTGWREGAKPSREYLMDAMQCVIDSEMKDSEKQEQLEMLNFELSGNNISDADNNPCTSIADIPIGSVGSSCSVFTSSGGGGISLREGNINVDTNLYGIVQPKSWFRDNDPDAPEFSAEISLEQAKAKAEEFFDVMEIDGFELYFSDEARCVNMYTAEVYDTGWQLQYLRSFGYIPFSVSQYDASADGPFDFDNKWGKNVTEYSEPIKEGGITLYVTENGIELIYMCNPYEYVTTVNENVQLYDFNELKMRIQLLLGAAINDPYSAEGYYVMEEMILTVVPTPKKDSSEYYMMPVWICKIGEYVSLGDGLGLSHFYVPGEQVFEQWLTIAFNAIDGTRVSLPQG